MRRSPWRALGGVVGLVLLIVGVPVVLGGGDAQVDVEDTGIGIEVDMLPQMFDTFSQADRSLDRA